VLGLGGKSVEVKLVCIVLLVDVEVSQVLAQVFWGSGRC
jgi:hypothetical protein